MMGRLKTVPTAGSAIAQKSPSGACMACFTLHVPREGDQNFSIFPGHLGIPLRMVEVDGGNMLSWG
jgi:hypothetical protein